MCHADARDYRRVAKNGWRAGEVVKESNAVGGFGLAHGAFDAVGPREMEPLSWAAAIRRGSGRVEYKEPAPTRDFRPAVRRCRGCADR